MSSYPPQPDDSNTVPIGCVYVPSVGFVPLLGSTNTYTDGSGNKYAPPNFNLSQVGAVAPQLDGGSLNRLGVSLYGKQSAAGDTPLLLDASGRPLVNIAQIGGQAPTLDNTSIQAVSMRGKGAGTAGDTPLLVDALGQMTVEQFVQYQIMQGHGFSATTGLLSTGASSAFICLQLAVNAISKRVLVFAIQVANSNVMSDGRLYTASVATADTALTTSLVAYNLQPKSATTSSLTTIAGSPAATTQTSGFTGSQSQSYACGANSVLHLLQNGVFLYFANGDTASVEVANKVPTSANSASITAYWIEW